MTRLFAIAFVALLLSGCSTRKTASVAEDFPERKAYVTCAVTRAFMQAVDTMSEEEAVVMAIDNCRSEREAVYTRLTDEHPGNPVVVEAYMDALHATMREHIALRLAQARRKAMPGLTT